ncbi:hypothetical protein NliqN6_1507 [Naganishia liquefaciens]|uniref:Aminomethyltransferase folate-binding domain-containing protein n=1 Tax=Naganishia liquefaciens TaxID=104408 RepID=A0A8H3YD78_9TREE|nr:hypothetical protein NliqN6_1507 [Naganishia liquefaciens]
MISRRPITLSAGRCRLFSSSARARYDYRKPQAAQVQGRSILRVQGKDAAKFLKGLTCKDVDGLPGGGYSGFINPTGRVMHDVFIFHQPATDTYWIDHSADASASTDSTPNTKALYEEIKRYVLRSKVKLKYATEEYDVWSVYGTPANDSAVAKRWWKFGSGGAAEPQWEFQEEAWKEIQRGLREGEVGCWDLRGGWGQEGMGRRLLVKKGETPLFGSDHDIGNSNDYNLRRMLLGVPEGPAEIIPGSALPLESCMDVTNGVDFRKGCYVGQELTVRTYHTGNTRKRIAAIRFLPSSSTCESSALPPNGPLKWSDFQNQKPVPEAGQPISYLPPPTSASQKPKSAVKVLSVHPEFAVGLGMIRLELADRVWGTSAFGEAPKMLGKDGELGKLVVAGDASADWQVWAGRGRAWYEPNEDVQQSAAKQQM